MFFYGFPPNDHDPLSNEHKKNRNKQKLSLDELAVIAALLTNALRVESILISRNQRVEIILSGSLKQKTELERIIELLSQAPLEDLLFALLQNRDS